MKIETEAELYIAIAELDKILDSGVQSERKEELCKAIHEYESIHYKD